MEKSYLITDTYIQQGKLLTFVENYFDKIHKWGQKLFNM